MIEKSMRDAWMLLAHHVAGASGLGHPEAESVARHFADSMETYTASANEVRDSESHDLLEMYQKLMDLNSARRDSLSRSLAGFLDRDVAEEILGVLGAFSEQRDAMLECLASMSLDEKDRRRALDLVCGYIADCEQSRVEGMAKKDYEGILAAMGKRKADLDREMDTLLASADLKTWKASTRFSMGRNRPHGSLKRPAEPYRFPEDHPLRLVSVEVDPLYKDMLRPRFDGWLGSDVGHSIVLSQDRSLWLFGDTFIGDLEQSGRRVWGAPMINNTIGIQDRRATPPDCMRFHWKQHDGKPASFFPHQEGTEGAYYWPTAGVMLEGELFIYHWCVGGNAQNAGGYGISGSAVTRIPNPLDPPEQWIQKTVDIGLPKGTVFHVSVYVEAPYVYFFGLAGHGHSALARARIKDLLAGGLAEVYEYYVNTPDGPAWSGEPGDFIPMLAPACTECTVHYDDYLGMYTCLTYTGGPVLFLTCAPEITGPWTRPEPFYWVPEHETLPVWIISYAVRQHPELSARPGELVITYATNAPGSIEPHFSEECKEVYFNRFLRVKLERNA